MRKLKAFNRSNFDSIIRDSYLGASSIIQSIGNLNRLPDMTKRKLEFLVLGSCALFGLFWGITTDYFSHIGLELNWLINISSLLAVASFSVRAMLPLRTLAVASQAFAIPYFLLQPTPLWTPVGWTALFMAINLYHITRILLELSHEQLPHAREPTCPDMRENQHGVWCDNGRRWLKNAKGDYWPVPTGVIL